MPIFVTEQKGTEFAEKPCAPLKGRSVFMAHGKTCETEVCPEDGSYRSSGKLAFTANPKLYPAVKFNDVGLVSAA
ncbi:hypothetical protein phiPLPE_64 [Iodobacter phage PhiPLPE]|uniref:Uncharacterized protein n=1 Tax=Iodobacter phage PhiPLPE TaxID=551895 RepID=B5AX83_9CAUD|nr:hypothetical protein phiPLPE_64 [Iodobacter phage PhiPLPE]ACG60386.1 hypothetical protein phiPLPE_64 [Iodobacter phage PhiPLPE]